MIIIATTSLPSAALSSASVSWGIPRRSLSAELPAPRRRRAQLGARVAEQDPAASPQPVSARAPTRRYLRAPHRELGQSDGSLSEAARTVECVRVPGLVRTERKNVDPLRVDAHGHALRGGVPHATFRIGLRQRRETYCEQRVPELRVLAHEADVVLLARGGLEAMHALVRGREVGQPVPARRATAAHVRRRQKTKQARFWPRTWVSAASWPGWGCSRPAWF